MKHEYLFYASSDRSTLNRSEAETSAPPPQKGGDSESVTRKCSWVQ